MEGISNLKPIIITKGKRAIYDRNDNRLTLEFFFPAREYETGEIDLINGDVPRIIVKASPRVQVDRVDFQPRKHGKK